MTDDYEPNSNPFTYNLSRSQAAAQAAREALEASRASEGTSAGGEAGGAEEEGEGCASGSQQHARTRAVSTNSPVVSTNARRAPLWQPGKSGNPGGRPKGASPKAALLRKLAANPDADGIGRESVELGEKIAVSAQELAEAWRSTEDPKLIAARAKALDSLLGVLAYLEPNVRKVETSTTSQRIVLRMDGASQPPPRTVDAGEASEVAQGPIQGGTMQRGCHPLLEQPAPTGLPSASTASSSASQAFEVEEKPHPLGP